MHLDELHSITLENGEYVELLLKYLAILQEGRVKPNSKLNNISVKTSSNITDLHLDSTIRESVDNFGDIVGVKALLNSIFKVNHELVIECVESKGMPSKERYLNLVDKK